MWARLADSSSYRWTHTCCVSSARAVDGPPLAHRRPFSPPSPLAPVLSSPCPPAPLGPSAVCMVSVVAAGLFSGMFVARRVGWGRVKGKVGERDRCPGAYRALCVSRRWPGCSEETAMAQTASIRTQLESCFAQNGRLATPQAFWKKLVFKMIS